MNNIQGNKHAASYRIENYEETYLWEEEVCLFLVMKDIELGKIES